MLALFIVFLETALLFFLSRQLLKTLSNLLFSITNSRKITTEIITLIFLPGTIIHELSHVFVASLLFVPTGRLNFSPVIEEGRIKAATLEVAKTDPLRRALIGLAPLLVGLAVSIGLIVWFYQANQALITSSPLSVFALKETYILAFILFQVTNTMYASQEDLEGLLALGATIILLAAATGLTFWIREIHLPSVLSKISVAIPSFIPATLGVTLIVNSLIFLILLFLLRVTKNLQSRQ